METRLRFKSTYVTRIHFLLKCRREFCFIINVINRRRAFCPGDVQRLSVEVFLPSSSLSLSLSLFEYDAHASQNGQSSVQNVCLNEVRLPRGAKFSGSCRTICNESFPTSRGIYIHTYISWKCTGHPVRTMTAAESRNS